MDELEAMKSHVELAAGHLLQALKCAAKLAESQPTAPNTVSPKLPTLEDVRNGIVAAGVCSEIGLDMNMFGAGVNTAHDFICRQLRAGA